MKKIIIALMLATSGLIFGQQTNLEQLIDKYSEKDDYTMVYISKFMFDLLREVDVDLDDKEAEEILKHLNSIIILTKEGITEDTFRNDMKNIMQQENFQTLMRIKEDGENITFMAIEEMGRIKEFVMLVDAPEDATLIYIKGDITTKQLSNLSKTMSISGLEKLDSLDHKNQ